MAGYGSRQLSEITGTGEGPNQNNAYLQSSINLFPNPATGGLTIESNLGLEIEKIEIYNTLGQKVHEMDVNKKLQTFSMNMAMLSAGNYMLKITTGKGIIIKQVAVE